MDKRYNPKAIEEKWQKKWMNMNYWKFNREDNKKPIFVIDTPPPFTNGELHMGHAYWVWINDTIARYKRMRGYNVLLPQGWDCHGLPTELRAQKELGITKNDRTQFTKACIKFTENMIRIMKEAMRKIGYTPDWRFEYRTMDKEYMRCVQETLIKLHKKGLIYRKTFPTYWCPKCETALAQAETGYIEKKGKLYYIKFKTNIEKDIIIATTRPELIPACVAVAINPNDTRYIEFHNQKALVPIFDREIPIITDDDVDIEYGTGAVMICTYGDEQDIQWVMRYKLPERIILNEKGRLIGTGKYDKLTTIETREAIVRDLKALGLIVKEEIITHNVLSHTERGDCKAPIEFIPKPQWFLKILNMKETLKKLAHEIRWTPEHMKKRLLDWIEEISWDWIISRQRVFGTPIPFWYCENCGYIIAPDKKQQLPIDPTLDRPPMDRCPKCNSTKIRSDSSVCDVWLDSSITPLIITKYFDNKDLFRRLYPTTIRQQGYDIIRTWAFYTIIRCYLETNKKPWNEILINGMILGPDGKEMSKSRGNIISPLEGIEKFGSDAMRIAILLVKIGDDYAFKWKDVVFASRLLQKLWSANRLLWLTLKEINEKIDLNKKTLEYGPPEKWMAQRIREFIEKSDKDLESYRFDIFLKGLTKLFWKDLCSTYIEKIKDKLYNNNKKEKYITATILMKFLWIMTRFFAPFAPHTTEELYQQIYRKFSKSINYKTIHQSPWPTLSEL